MGRELVLRPVAGKEGDPPPADLANDQRRGGLAVGGLDLDRLGVLEEGVEAGASKDADVGGAQADFSFGAEGFESAAFLSDFVSDVVSDVVADDDSLDFDDDEDESSDFEPLLADLRLSVA